MKKKIKSRTFFTSPVYTVEEWVSSPPERVRYIFINFSVFIDHAAGFGEK